MRAIRKEYSRALRHSDASMVLDLARALLAMGGLRWVAYELIHNHPEAMGTIGEPELEELGRGMDSWGAVDTFSLELSGPAWRERQVTDDLIADWAKSPDRWWRRASLVSTVPLNARARGGRGDVQRTLFICEALVTDRDDMVVKALSWALRELIPHDCRQVLAFLEVHAHVISGRVRREVTNKLETGLKTPRRTGAE
jgi:3-methyladenine DNA glycosylase AlkD